MANLSAEAGGARSARTVLWAAIFVAGLAGWIVCAATADAERAWRALLINFIYFTPLAAGMVAWPAAVMGSRGRWARTIEQPALAGIAFAPVSLLTFAALWFGRAHWAGWMRYRHLPNAAWLNTTFLFARDGAALVVLWALAAWFVARRQRGRPVALACWVAFAYCAVFTLLGFDMVMALDPHWFSTLFGGYFFVSGLYAALAAWTLITALRFAAPDKERLHDLGKLMVAFSLLTMYMMFSQLLPQWYENLPNEVRYVVPRLRFDRWGWVSAALAGGDLSRPAGDSADALVEADAEIPRRVRAGGAGRVVGGALVAGDADARRRAGHRLDGGVHHGGFRRGAGVRDRVLPAERAAGRE